MRDLWTAKRRQQAHHKRHHDTPSGRTTPGARPQVVAVRRICAVVRVIVEAMAGRFRLYDGRTTRFLGGYGTRAGAWAAADEHLLTCLAASGDWVVAEYLVVSRGVAASLDDDFAAYIDSAWTARVEPALLEIREAIEDNKYLRQLTGELISGTPLAAGATAGLAMALGEGTATGVITATASWLIAGASSSAKSARDGANAASRGAFWFLHETERRLRAAG